jgi:hypothetical protein
MGIDKSLIQSVISLVYSFVGSFSSIYRNYHLVFSYDDEDDDTIKQEREEKSSSWDENIQLSKDRMITDRIYQHDRHQK